jgi:hypothetical protein
MMFNSINADDGNVLSPWRYTGNIIAVVVLYYDVIGGGRLRHRFNFHLFQIFVRGYFSVESLE